jgi:hypothetical protein
MDEIYLKKARKLIMLKKFFEEGGFSRNVSKSMTTVSELGSEGRGS